MLLVDERPLVGASQGAAIERQGEAQERVTMLEAARVVLRARSADIRPLDVDFPEGPDTDLVKNEAVAVRLPRPCVLIVGAIDPDEVKCAFADCRKPHRRQPACLA